MMEATCKKLLAIACLLPRGRALKEREKPWPNADL